MDAIARSVVGNLGWVETGPALPVHFSVQLCGISLFTASTTVHHQQKVEVTTE